MIEVWIILDDFSLRCILFIFVDSTIDLQLLPLGWDLQGDPGDFAARTSGFGFGLDSNGISHDLGKMERTLWKNHEKPPLGSIFWVDF